MKKTENIPENGSKLFQGTAVYMNRGCLSEDMSVFMAHLDVHSATRTSESFQIICSAEEIVYDITGTKRLEVE